MTFPRRLFLLFSILLLTASRLSAQTPLGQPTLDEQKVQIWCATARYVYDDNNRPNLKNSLNCGGSLQDFVSSIKADSQKVYSMLYQPLEGKGTMYKGLGSDKSRLQKLTTEIITKLQASPARRADAARMAKLTTLKGQLDAYVTNGTPPADLNEDVTAGATDTEEAAVVDEAALATTDAGVGQGAVEANTVAPRPAASESLMSKLFAPLALILSLLSIFLYVMLRRSISALGTRADRHRSELESVKAAALSGSAPSAGVVAANASKRMTPELQREIERIVQQRVAEELAKQQSAPIVPALKAEAPAPRQAAPVAQAPNRATNVPNRAAGPPAPSARRLRLRRSQHPLQLRRRRCRTSFRTLPLRLRRTPRRRFRCTKRRRHPSPFLRAPRLPLRATTLTASCHPCSCPVPKPGKRQRLLPQ
ncbi:hypothetical protein [Hymenobacter cellulosilyticus]|uniref:Uncharacterized protein n=1 Tax=Hymenobacter cellulosilyticus TaxID=2932248 RepID=A0A8T9Q7V7_9BACT|nr:hypothetical protein [Hymenobacter cellulosilyticus]UOQ73656.1 hypothetical protein MUN79_06945 [Hymenobacter cellulosilyticus]